MYRVRINIGTNIMARYRAYLLDDQGNILSREEIDVPDDAAAIDAGRDLANVHSADIPDPVKGFEVWRDRELMFSTHPRLGVK